MKITQKKKMIQKTTEATSDLIGNKITKASKTSPQNLETNEEILWKKYISPELRQKIIDNLILKKD